MIRRASLCVVLLTLSFATSFCWGQILPLPPRPPNAVSGSNFANSITNLDRVEREQRIFETVLAGDFPDFLRHLVPVQVALTNHGIAHTATFMTTPDYLAVGTESDYFIAPLSPIMAQRIATALHCTLPTTKMVDEIYANAPLKLEPLPIPASPRMATVPVFIDHNQLVWAQRQTNLTAFPLGTLVAGHQKDVVISARLPSRGDKVAVYGWHRLNGKPIQPLYTGHADFYADYSHGIRLIQSALIVDGKPSTIAAVLSDSELAPLLSNEGVVTNATYPTNFFSRAPLTNTSATGITLPALSDFKPASFDEQTLSWSPLPDVLAQINAPQSLPTNQALELIFYALPNGNTIAQTAGRKLQSSNDWQFNIQHIAAQTRFLRRTLTNRSLIVIYLQSTQKSWPAWRHAHNNNSDLITNLIASVTSLFASHHPTVTLSSHSGGGSFMFGYLNGVSEIPSNLDRIVFLDSNYAYDSKLGHDHKLISWLKSSDQHYLCVLAYNDAFALLHGTNFVSASGGTWGRSHAMLSDLQSSFAFNCQTNNGLATCTALAGRVEFLLKENPDHQIFHTVQVERNGFIEANLSGTSAQGRGYTYFGDRAYSDFIGD